MDEVIINETPKKSFTMIVVQFLEASKPYLYKFLNFVIYGAMMLLRELFNGISKLWQRN